ncbi:MAG: hypothetical protein ACI94O_000807, partial [Octadecabacter sp.]
KVFVRPTSDQTDIPPPPQSRTVTTAAMRSASGAIIPSKWQHNPSFSNTSQSATNNMAIPENLLTSLQLSAHYQKNCIRD